jgi:hypothetical protein
MSINISTEANKIGSDNWTEKVAKNKYGHLVSETDVAFNSLA